MATFKKTSKLAIFRNLCEEETISVRRCCNQIGPFLKVLGDKFSCKGSPNIWQLLGYCDNITFK